MPRFSVVARTVGVCLLATAGGWAWVAFRSPEAQAQESQLLGDPTPLSTFMRQKLLGSNQILEGLALEDMELIKTGAKQLSELSSSERWRISNDPLYGQFSAEFQRNSSDLVKAAENNNLDQAALKWMAATMNCIECHRYARNKLLAHNSGVQR